MKYNFEAKVPLHQKDEVVGDLLDREVTLKIAEGILPLVNFKQMETVLEYENNFLRQTPKFKASGTLYIYRESHMDHIQRMLQVVKSGLIANPDLSRQIDMVLNELENK